MKDRFTKTKRKGVHFRMKRTVSLLLALVILSTALLSCSKNGNGDSTTAGGSSASTNAPESTTDAATEPPTEPEQEDSIYLFAYFTGNAPEQERICFAVSRDGYRFSPLNLGQPVITSHSGTGGIRDPYIFKGHDGAYYIIATDMRADNYPQWDNNSNLISWRSEDLVNWTDETVIEVGNKFPVTQNTTRAWAPQAIWDDERGEYMIYFALRSDGTNRRTVMYYAYSPDLKTLSTEPKELLVPTNGHDAIDADIIEHDGKYYMFFKDETSGGIRLTVSDKINTGYSYDDSVLVSIPGLAVEGSTTYKLLDGSGWLLISDAYGSGFFTMAKTEDLEHYTHLTEGVDFIFSGFTPRHGSIITITNDQFMDIYRGLKK